MLAEIVSILYKKIALIHPRLEVRLRQLYWRNINKLNKYNPNRNTATNLKSENNDYVDFDEIIDQLKDLGVKEGSLLIVHSSFDSLRSTGLKPNEIISKLRNLVGESGTLAMPVIRLYKEEAIASERISSSYIPQKCIYNPKRTPVSSGLLPTFLMRTPEAEISLHPLNPLCAVGSLAKDMMVNNIKGDKPSPHGKNSSWKFCMDHNAIVISLGTDLRHHNTMGHVAEEAFDDWYWSDENWYNERDFVIEKSKDENIVLTVKERKPRWGMLHQAELNRYNDLKKNNIIKTRKIGSILIELEFSQELIRFLRSKNKKGYPYFE